MQSDALNFRTVMGQLLPSCQGRVEGVERIEGSSLYLIEGSSLYL